MIIKIILIQLAIFVMTIFLSRLRSLKRIDDKKTSIKKKIRVFIIILIPFIGLAVLLQIIAVILFLSDEQLVKYLNKGEVKFEVNTDDE